MIWLTWRQHRTEALVVAVLLVLTIIVLIITGLDLRSAAQITESGMVARLIDSYNIFLTPILLFPLLLGMFVGAPLLARELEQGTYRLVWTQGVAPFQWLKVKLAFIGGATLLAAGVLFVVFTWWNQPVNAALGPWRTFDEQGLVIFAYALFGLALGVALGALVGKTTPAMALTIPVFLLIRVGLEFLRMVYLPPLSALWNFSAENPQGRDWILSQRLVDSTGHPLSFEAIKVCISPLMDQVKGSSNLCYQDNGIFQQNIFQPASRFWIFQGIETFIFLLLAAGLLILAFKWVKRRIQN